MYPQEWEEWDAKVSQRSVLQDCFARVPHKESHKSFHKSAPRVCVSHKRVRQECPARLSFAVSPVSQEWKCWTGVSYKSVPSHTSVLQECHTFFFTRLQTRVAHKSVPQGSQKEPHKGFLEACPTRVYHKNVPNDDNKFYCWWFHCFGSQVARLLLLLKKW